jgi:hypothetical protein
MPGNVAVRFSVEDQEVVRKALDDLGAQGQGALKKMDDASKAPSSGMKSLSNIVDEIKGRMVGLAVPLGPIGSALIGMGPAGLVAAAGIGGVISALGKMSEMANDLATKSSRISNFAEQTGLSTDQVQALNLATVKYGKTSEETNAVVEKTAQAWDQLRKGQGSAFDEIRKIDPELLNQLSSAKDLAAALDILAKAYDKTGDEAGKIALARAFGGKGGASTLGAVFTGINDAGGFGPLTADAAKAGDVLNKQLVERLTTVQAQLKELREHNTDTFASLFAEHRMGAAREAQELIKSIVDGLKWIKENANDAAILKSLAGFANGSNPFGAVQTPGAGRGTRSGREGDLDSSLAPEPTRLTVGAVPAPVPLEVQLRNYRDYVAALGAAVTPTEQLKLKTLELDVAQKNNVFSTVAGSNAERDRARAQEAASQSLKQASEAVRERFGIATEENIVEARMAQLRKARADGDIKSDEEFARAEQLLQREARQTAEAMELKQLEIDGRSLSKSLDTGITSSLGGVENALTDVATGSVTASDGIKNLETAVVRSTAQMIIRMTVTASIAKALGAAFNAFGIGGGGGITVPGFNPIAGVTGSAAGNVFAGGNVIPFADGGIVSRLSHFMMANGRPASMAENGEEAIMPLTRINGKLGVVSAGGGQNAAPVVHLSVINNTGVAAQASQSQGPNGDISVQLDKMIDGAVGKSLSSGSGRRVLAGQFGVKPFTGQ